MQILEVLEDQYGPQKLAGPKDPYEMIVFLNCGYPATDEACAKCFDAIKREIGVQPKLLLKASKVQLVELARPGGIFPNKRVERWWEIARKVRDEFKGDLTAAVKQRLRDAKDEPAKSLRAAKKILQEFPGIGEPSAEKILLFSGLAIVAAIPSAFVHAPVRLFMGEPGKNYAADYRAARAILDSSLPKSFEARQRAYLLLKKHAREICKRSKPKCEVCPLTEQCAYLQAKAADVNTETE